MQSPASKQPSGAASTPVIRTLSRCGRGPVAASATTAAAAGGRTTTTSSPPPFSDAHPLHYTRAAALHRAAGSCWAFPEKGPHVGDLVLGHRRGEHRRALLVGGAAAAEGFDGHLGLPALEDVDAAGVDQVGRDGEVEAASCPACLFDDAHAAREVGLALLGLDGDVSCNDDHGALLFCTPMHRATRQRIT